MLKLKKIRAFQIIAILLVITIIIACKDSDKKIELSTTDEIDVYCISKNDEDSTKCLLYEASVYALLSHIKDFEGKRVVTCGYLYADTTFEAPNYALYPNEIDFKEGMFTNALLLEIIKNDEELYRGMKAPYGVYACIYGDVSLYIGRTIRHGLKNAKVSTLLPLLHRRINGNAQAVFENENK